MAVITHVHFGPSKPRERSLTSSFQDRFTYEALRKEINRMKIGSKLSAKTLLWLLSGLSVLAFTLIWFREYMWAHTGN